MRKLSARTKTVTGLAKKEILAVQGGICGTPGKTGEPGRRMGGDKEERR